MFGVYIRKLKRKFDTKIITAHLSFHTLRVKILIMAIYLNVHCEALSIYGLTS